MFGAVMLMSSCAEDPVVKTEFPMPNSLKDKVDYTQFENLKDAVAPNVVVSGVLPATEIVEGGTSKIIATKNFSEVTMADFSHKASVKKDGTTSFSDLKSFVKAATKGGFSVYGGPIMANTDLNKDYLAKVIQNKVDPDAEPFYEEKEVERTFIKVETQDKVFQNWDTQFWIVTKDGFKKGDDFVFTAEVKADIPVSIGASTHKIDCYYEDWQANFTVPFTKEWKKVEFEGKFLADGGSLAMDLNTEAKANIYYFDNVSLKVNGKEQIDNGSFDKGTEHEQFRRIAHYTGAADGHDNDPRTPVPISQSKAVEKVEVPAGPYTLYKNVLVNSDLEGDVLSAFVDKIYPQKDPAAMPATHVADDGKDGKGIKLVVPAKVSDPWDSQFWIVLPEGLEVNSSVKVEFDYKADQEAKVTVQTHKEPGAYLGGGNGMTDFTCKTDWAHYSASYKIVDDAASIAFNLNEVDFGNTYYFDNVTMSIAKDTLIGGTPLTQEEKTDTLGKYLDAYIAELMDATPEVSAWDAVLDPIAAADAESVDFDWITNCGDDYVAFVTKSAKAHYAGTDPLKLFVAISNAQVADNVTNIAGNFAAWEKKGAIIDGVNAHVTLDLAAGKDGIDAMIKALASTGKSIKITFDGFSEVLGSDLSEAASLINYLAQKYTTGIDSAKQYGFAVTNLNTTVWDAKYERNEVYKGLVLGLKGQAYTK